MMKDEHQKIIIAIEAYLHQVAGQFGIELLGSYNPHKYNLKAGDFTDGYHGKKSVMDLIWKKKESQE